MGSSRYRVQTAGFPVGEAGERVGGSEPPRRPRAGMEPQSGWGPDSKARVVSSQQAQGRPLQAKLASTRLLSPSPTTMKAESDSGKELEN